MSKAVRAKRLAEQMAREAAAIASGQSHGDYEVVDANGEVIGPKPVLWDSVRPENGISLDAAGRPSR